MSYPNAQAAMKVLYGELPAEADIDEEVSPSLQALGMEIAVAALREIFEDAYVVGDRVISEGHAVAEIMVRKVHSETVYVSFLPYPNSVSYWPLRCLKLSQDHAFEFLQDCAAALRASDLHIFARLFAVEEKHNCISQSPIRRAAYNSAVRSGDVAKPSLLQRLRDALSRR